MTLPLERQVCSLDLAKRLKELGVKQESLYYYAHQDALRSKESLIGSWNQDTWPEWVKEVNGGEVYSAFTVAELGELLPKYVGANRIGVSWNKANGWHVFYHQDDLRHIQYIETERAEADARAKMLIYLIENNFITP